MTTQTAVFSGIPTGLTLTKKVFTVADPDTEVTGITGAVQERTNAKGQYVVAVTKAAVITGDHTIIMFVGSSPIAIGKRTFVGTNGEVATVTPEVAVLNTDTQGQIDAMTRGLIAGVVGSSSSTTVVNVTSTESGLAVTDQLKGRVIIFNKDTTTAALRGQGAPIDTNDTTSITVASGDAFTTAPDSGDTFTIY